MNATNLSAVDSKRYCYYLYIYFLRQRRNKQDCENLVRKVWLRITTNEYSEAEIRTGYALLRSVAKSVLIDDNRKHERSPYLVEVVDADLDMQLELLSARWEPPESIQQLCKRLDEVWLDLPQTVYEVWALHKVDGVRQKIVARELNLSPHTVKTYVTIANKRLREATLRDTP